MVRRLAAAGLSIVVSQVLAQEANWVVHGRTSVATIFIDHNSIKRINGATRIWVRSNYREPNNNVQFTQPALSTLSQVLIDCQAERWTLAYVAYYSQPDAKGIVVWSKTIPKEQLVPTPAAPDTLGAEYVAVGCKN